MESTQSAARVPDLSISEHVALAERHAQRALDLAYADEPQSLRVRLALGRAQSTLISLITSGRLR
jgi:hypothetical protein